VMEMIGAFLIGLSVGLVDLACIKYVWFDR
jgi:hypothetical protein